MNRNNNHAWVIEGRCAGGWRLLEIKLTRSEIRYAMKCMRVVVCKEFHTHLRIRKVVFD